MHLTCAVGESCRIAKRRSGCLQAAEAPDCAPVVCMQEAGRDPTREPPVIVRQNRLQRTALL